MDPLFSTFDFAALLFIMAAAIGVLNERTIDLPRPIALLIGALLISGVLMMLSSLLPYDLDHRARLRLSHADLPKLLLDGILALLLFAASLHVDVVALRRRAVPIFVLASIGVFLATGLFGVGIYGVFAVAGVGVPLVWCLVLGAILAPTDAVAVDQLLKRVHMPGELRALISGESLFNDGAAVVLFFALLAAASGDPHALGNGRIAIEFVVGGVGAAMLGLGAGYFGAFVLRKTKEPTLSVIISLALVFGTYRGAAWLDISGPIAVVVAGLVFFHSGPAENKATAHRAALKDFWAIADDLVNTLLFLFMGFEILAVPFLSGGWLPILAAVPLALIVRFLSVSPPVLLERAPPGGRWPAIGVLTWTGLRGGISLALVLGLPEGPYRDALAAVCYAVVVFTVIVQGLTTPAVIRSLYRGDFRSP
ncbi:cation:proton antiporter [Kaistia algarum]|uniref:cation:proton antiporter n=1 Tax=Kaistia algarum TaxID=2083279 RepID=UPI001403E268|nr:sodium:proton antiporter [Kaistia algarum]MCX5516490.1 sodium:proton antiporter [Kaistia algarum]